MGSDNFATTAAAAAAVPVVRYERCVICPCNAAICYLHKLRRSDSTPTNVGREFYKCSALQCPKYNKEFYKWVDDVPEDAWLNVPYCVGCGAGVCRVRKETEGENAGRILFMCRLKKGQGSCGFEVWQDELEMSAAGQADSSVTLPPSTPTECNPSSPTNINLVADSRRSENGLNSESPVIGTSKYLRGCTAVKQLQFQDDDVDESLRSPPKRLHDGSRKDVSPPSDSGNLVQHDNLVNSGTLTTPVKDFVGEKDPLNCVAMVQDPNLFNRSASTTITRSPPEVGNSTPPRFEEPTRPANVLPKLQSEGSGLRHIAEGILNNLLSHLETMDAKDHEAMNLQADATFFALDRLFFDYGHLKEHVKELIHHARTLDEIKKSMHRNGTCQNLVHCFNGERTTLNEIDTAYAKTVRSVNNCRKRVKILKNNISAAKDWLFEAEAEYVCLELELKNMEYQMEQISKEKEFLEGNYRVASKKMEDSRKLDEQRKVAEAAFDRAKIMLRG